MARTRQHEPVADSTKMILAVWAVVGPTIGLIAGVLIGYAAWGGRASPPQPEGPVSRRTETRRPAGGPASARKSQEPEQSEPRSVAKPPGEKPRRRAKPERWLKERGLPEAQLVYYFSPRPAAMLALSNRLSEHRLGLSAKGPVKKTRDGVVFSDGGKLMSVDAGKALAAKLRASGAFSVETFVCPADTRHRGPARIVSLSYNGSVRNFTLAQEGDRWSVRLRTTRNDLNGCRPQITVAGLAARWTHVVVTYDGSEERVYLDGRLAKRAGNVSGSLGNWETSKYPLVLGNEAYDSRNWAGTIKFVAFYGRALSAAEVRKAANSLPAVSSSSSSGAKRDDVF
jgi:hypothetical protein